MPQAASKPVIATCLTLLLGLLWSAWAAAQDYRIGLCLWGCPEGAGEANQLILRPIYALSFNSRRKTADWVAYRVTRDSIGIASRLSRAPRPDDYVTETFSAEDFRAGTEQGLVLGHYVPLVSFAATPWWDDVNYLSNAVPLSEGLSRGAWYGLDWAVRNLVNREGELFILVGPVYHQQGSQRTLPAESGQRIPDAFFQVVMTASGRGAAFILEQDASVGVHHCQRQVGIAAVEAATGLRLFPEQPAAAIRSESLAAELGCR